MCFKEPTACTSVVNQGHVRWSLSAAVGINLPEGWLIHLTCLLCSWQSHVLHNTKHCMFQQHETREKAVECWTICLKQNSSVSQMMMKIYCTLFRWFSGICRMIINSGTALLWSWSGFQLRYIMTEGIQQAHKPVHLGYKILLLCLWQSFICRQRRYTVFPTSNYRHRMTSCETQ